MQHYCPVVGISHRYCAVAAADGFLECGLFQLANIHNITKGKRTLGISISFLLFIVSHSWGTIAMYGDFISVLLLTYFKNITES